MRQKGLFVNMSNELYKKDVEFLKQSPIFAMSLGSKELFHSNFWAYLMEQADYKRFINFFFPDADVNSIKWIAREYKNRDIVICISDKEYVIENKIKSYPDYDQLCRYGEDNNMHFGIVTGIKKPPFILPEKWGYKSYGEISAFLRGIKSSNEELEKLVFQYCNVLDTINRLMNYSLDETNNQLLFWDDNLKVLDDVRLMDVFRKLKADDFYYSCLELEREMQQKAKEHDTWEFYISRSFHNGKATISFEFLSYLHKEDEKEYRGQIGVQIEDDQFRIFLGVRNEMKKTINEVFEKGKSMNWFDSNFDKKQNRKVFGHDTLMSKNPCNYSGTWIYQYFNISKLVNQKRYSYAYLKELIHSYLDGAVALLDEVNEYLE